MNDLLGGLLKGVAPALATAVAGPLGGAAVSAIANKLGVGDSVEEVAKAIAGDPAATAKLQELELEFAKIDAANTADARKMNADIQNSATASWLAKNIAYVIDVAIIAGALTMTFVVFIIGVPEQNKSMAFTALGSLWTLTGTVVNFHRGSSAGSKAKTDELMKGMK
jgi:hypothetical protein